MFLLMTHRSTRCIARLSATMLCGLASLGAHGASVLLISVDGMKPEYVTHAAEHGLKVPFLAALLTTGAYADGVQGVWPTSTYPSHTTLLTGVSPAEHGITNNLEFDPRHTFNDAWNWYAQRIRAPTLWQVAHRAGLVTASIGWPVSVGATDVDFLIPEYWRNFRRTADLNPTDREMIADLCRPEGLLRELEARLGPYLMGNDTSLAADEIKTVYSIDLMQRHRPRLMTVHLSSLDAVEHEFGPFSPQANQDMEALDGMIRRMVEAARRIDPATFAVIVSDHGFVALRSQLNLYLPFLEAGLIEATDTDKASVVVHAWTAQPWSAGGLAAIVQRDPRDQATHGKVRLLLQALAADAGNGIATLLEGDAITQTGGFPEASFLVVMQPGVYTAGSYSSPRLLDMTGHGGHGFAPTFPDMRSAFFIAGPGIARHRDLGLVDMRQIAPTLAGLLGLPMPSAAAVPLAVRQ
jgi:predicted AlkP superfamily pyrophosphatase or phosphodiesterase